MEDHSQSFTGVWLHAGEMRGQHFSHNQAVYDHNEGGSRTSLKHAFVDQNGQEVGVWVPATWSDDEVAEALNSNW